MHHVRLANSTGEQPHMAAGRIAFALDLRGPAVNINTVRKLETSRAACRKEVLCGSERACALVRVFVRTSGVFIGAGCCAYQRSVTSWIGMQ